MFDRIIESETQVSVCKDCLFLRNLPHLCPLQQTDVLEKYDIVVFVDECKARRSNYKCGCPSSPPGFVAQDGIHCGFCKGVLGSEWNKILTTAGRTKHDRRRQVRRR